MYDDLIAEQWAEDQMMAEALNHWLDSGRVRRVPRPRQDQWWNRPVLRDLETERNISMIEIAEAIEERARQKRRRRAKPKAARSHSSDR